MSRVELKTKAKKSLKGNWWNAIKTYLLVYIILYGISFVCGFINGFFGSKLLSLLFDVVSLLAACVLNFGLFSFFLKLSRDEEVTYKELFANIKLAWPFVIISILTGIFTFLWSLLFIIPGIIAAIAYSQVYYIYLDNPELKPLEAIKKSKEMMQGHKMDYFVLQLSFLGWAILDIFTFGILSLWLVPYLNVTNANFYNSIKDIN